MMISQPSHLEESKPIHCSKKDWECNKRRLFKKFAGKLPSPAGYSSEDSQRHMITNLEEIHGRLHHHWVKGIFQHYQDKEHHPGTFLRRVPGNTWAQAQGIQNAASYGKATRRQGEMVGVAPMDSMVGVTGSYDSSRLLFWELLAHFFNALEAQDHLRGPSPLLGLSSASSPRRTTRATQFETAHILSVTYRIWAGIRAAQLREWQETWIHKSMHGGRAGARDARWSFRNQYRH